METGISGYFDLSGTGGVTARIYYSESYDPAANSSVLSVTSLQLKSEDYYGVTYYLSGTVSVGGSAVVTMDSASGTHSVTIPALNTFAAVSGSPAAPWSGGSLEHKTDGSGEAVLAVSLKGYTRSGGGGSGWSVSGSRTLTLTAIPRASTIGATDANIGAVSMIAVDRKSDSYTHSIAYTFGSLSGYVTASGGVSASEVKFTAASVPFTVPESFYAQIPSAKSGKCTLTIKTYSGSAQIGDTQSCAFTATASETACAPTVSGTVVDSNAATKALTGDASKLVRYCSTALCTITAAAKNSAAISSKSIGGTAVSGDTRSIPNVESGSVAFAATDSRGYSAAATVNATLIPYVKLTNNASAARTDPTSGNAKLTMKGNYYNDSFGAVDNTLEVKYRIGDGDYIAVNPTLNGNAYSASVSLSDLDYTQSYTVTVSVSDKLSAVTKALTIGPGVPVFDWGQNDMRVNVPLSVQGHALVPLYTFTVDGNAVIYDGVESNWSSIQRGPFMAQITRNGYFAAAFGMRANDLYGTYVVFGYGEDTTRRKLAGGVWSTVSL